MSQDNAVQLKQMITRLYLREKAFVYTKANPKTDCVDKSDIIFRLNESHNVKKQITVLEAKKAQDFVFGSHI